MNTEPYVGPVQLVEIRVEKPIHRFGTAVYVVGRTLDPDSRPCIQQADGTWHAIIDGHVEGWPPPTLFVDDNAWLMIGAKAAGRMAETPDLISALTDAKEDAREVRDRLLCVIEKNADPTSP